MLILQFQFPKVEDEKEQDLIPEFCNWICEQIYSTINTKINRRKIQLRVKYLYDVSWIQWTKRPKYTDVSEIMDTIRESLTYEQYRKGIWRIRTNTDIMLPNTHTSIDRIIRFLEYGDKNIRAMGMFTIIKNDFGFHELNSSWKLFIMERLGHLSETQIISDR